MITKKTEAKYTVEELTQQIHDLELFGLSFVGCTIKGEWNHFHFADSQLPASLYVVRSGAAAPSRATLIWSGRMLVEEAAVDVNVFRSVGGVAATASEAAGETDSLRALQLAEQDATPTISRNVVVERALSGVGTNTVYTLVNPRQPPLAIERWPGSGLSTDCSGFVSWCLRMSRKVPHPLYKKVNGGWFETTAVFEDGRQETGFFSIAANVRPGCLVVYPDRGGNEGHIGIVVAGTGSGVEGILEVVHCSSGNYKKTGKAIMKTSAQPWQAREDSLVLEYSGYS